MKKVSNELYFVIMLCFCGCDSSDSLSTQSIAYVESAAKFDSSTTRKNISSEAKNSNSSDEIGSKNFKVSGSKERIKIYNSGYFKCPERDKLFGISVKTNDAEGIVRSMEESWKLNEMLCQ